MISQKTLKQYDFQSIEDYYNYIIDSKINGNRKQVKDLYRSLSSKQKTEFIEYASTVLAYEMADSGETISTILIAVQN